MCDVCHQRLRLPKINTCTKLQLLLGETATALLTRTFEQCLPYLATRCIWRPAIPPSCWPTSALPTLPREATFGLKTWFTGVRFFEDFNPCHRFAIQEYRYTSCFLAVPCGMIPCCLPWKQKETGSLWRQRVFMLKAGAVRPPPPSRPRWNGTMKPYRYDHLLRGKGGRMMGGWAVAYIPEKYFSSF